MTTTEHTFTIDVGTHSADDIVRALRAHIRSKHRRREACAVTAAKALQRREWSKVWPA